MLQKFALGIVAGVLLAVPAMAETQSHPLVSDRTSEIICRTVPNQIGSLVGTRKVCMPRLDWERRQQHDQERLVQVQSDALLVTNHR